MPERNGRTTGGRREALAHALRALRRRTLVTGLLRALLLAIGADMAYDIVGIALFSVTGKSIYFPPFFVILLAVLTLRVLGSSTLPLLARRLDREHRLKDRLTSHLAFRRDPAIASDVVEAQAAETLASVDVPSLARRIRIRPLPYLALIAACSVALWFLLWRHPYTPPRNFVFRHGATLVTVVRGLLPEGHPPVPMQTAKGGPGSGEPGGGSGETGGGATGKPGGPLPADGTETPGTTGKADRPGVGAERTPTPAVADERKDDAGQGAKPPAGAERTRGAAGESPPGTRPGSSFSAQSRMRIISRETTRRPAGLTAGPPRPLIPPPSLAGTGGARNFLLPFLPSLSLADRLPGRDILLDPDTAYFAPEGYSGRYHDLILAYFRELNALKGENHGSY